MTIDEQYYRLAQAFAGLAEPEELQVGLQTSTAANVSYAFFSGVETIYREAIDANKMGPKSVLDFIQDYQLLDSFNAIEHDLLFGPEDVQELEVNQFGSQLVAAERTFKGLVGEISPRIRVAPWGARAGIREKMLGFDKSQARQLTYLENISDDEWLEALEEAGVAVESSFVTNRIQRAITRWYEDQSYDSESDELLMYRLTDACTVVGGVLTDVVPDLPKSLKDDFLDGLIFGVQYGSFLAKSRYAEYKPNKKDIFDAARITLHVDQRHPLLNAEIMHHSIRNATNIFFYRLNQNRAKNGLLGSSSPLSITPAHILQVAVEQTFLDLVYSPEEQADLTRKFRESEERTVKLVRLLYKSKDAFAGAVSLNWRNKPFGANTSRSVNESIRYGVETHYLPVNVAKYVLQDVISKTAVIRGVKDAVYAVAKNIITYASKEMGFEWVLQRAFRSDSTPGIQDIFYAVQDAKRDTGSEMPQGPYRVS